MSFTNTLLEQANAEYPHIRWDAFPLPDDAYGLHAILPEVRGFTQFNGIEIAAARNLSALIDVRIQALVQHMLDEADLHSELSETVLAERMAASVALA